jgi:hypothetical protein
LVGGACQRIDAPQTSQYYASLVLLALSAIVLVAFGLLWISRSLAAGGIKG